MSTAAMTGSRGSGRLEHPRRLLKIALLGLVASALVTVAAPAPAHAADLRDQCGARVGWHLVRNDQGTWQWVPNVTLRRGSRGICVAFAQQQLVLWHLTPGYEQPDVDGRFGPRTERAVRDFQSYFYPHAGPVDGIIGPRTWTDLAPALN
jgi:hypothetical protein